MTPQKLLEGAAANLEDAAKKLSSLANDLRAEHVDRHDVFGVRLEVVLVAADLREVNEHLLSLADKLLS